MGANCAGVGGGGPPPPPTPGRQERRDRGEAAMMTGKLTGALARAALVGMLAAAAGAFACRSGGGDSPTPAVETPEVSGTPEYGTPVAPPPTPLPVERGVEDSSDGIGVYPSVLKFPETLRGREYFGTVGIMNGGPSERTYRFEATGDAAGWLSFVGADHTTRITEVNVPARDRIQVLIKAVVPAEVPNGDYAGTIGVLTTTTTRAGADTSGAGVTLGAEVSVALAVTGTQRIEGQFIDAAASDVESGYPLRIATTLTNTGNVTMNPTIIVDIVDAAGNPVDRVTSSDQVLYPKDNKQIITEWDTTGRAVGERVGHVSVALGWVPLGTKDVRFNIVPVGTYTRRGELEDVRLVNKPQAGDYAKLVAVFANTGQIETKGKFVGELYLGDRLIEQMTSTEQLLLPGGTGDLDLLVRVPQDGAYTVAGKINYEGRETPVREYTFRVGAEGGRSTMLIALMAAAAAVIVVAAGGAGVWRLRRRGRPAS